MQLNVLYFAHVRQRVGRTSEVLQLPAGSTVADATAKLLARYPELESLMGVLRVALDGEFVGQDTPLNDGAELVLIPPVAGGADTPRVALSDAPLDQPVIDALTQLVTGPECGAVVTFVGQVRDHARGQSVSELHYEAYPSMALSELSKVVASVERDFAGVRAAVHHRVGTLAIGDAAVVVVTASAHRAEAFDACRAVIDRLKQSVPIWKRETGPDGAQWVSDRP